MLLSSKEVVKHHHTSSFLQLIEEKSWNWEFGMRPLLNMKF